MKKASFLKYAFSEGVNCYHYAIGFDRFAVVPIYGETGALRAFDWVTLTPGTCETFYRNSAERRLPWANVIDGCLEDGLIDLGQEFQSVAQHRTLAVYRKGTLEDCRDPHFAYFDGRNWRDKFPSGHPHVRPVTTGYLPPQTIGHYHFDRFMLSPIGIEPQCLKGKVRHELNFGTGRGMIRCAVLYPKSEVSLNWAANTCPDHDNVVLRNISKTLPGVDQRHHAWPCQ